MNRPAHLPRLDGLRGVAALGVLIFHMRIISSLGPSPFQEIIGIEWLQHHGWTLVDLFFVLSGFVFAHCYLENGKMRKGVTLSRFAWSRFARLWPLHAAMLAFAILVMREDPSTTIENITLSIGFLHIFIEEKNVLNAPAWSVSVEMACYAIFSIAALTGKRAMMIITALSIFIGAYLLCADISEMLSRGLIGFFSGVALRSVKDKTDAIPSIIILPAAILPFIVETDATGLIINALLGWPAVLLLAMRTKLLELRAFQWVGDRSYAIYMSHVPILLLVGSLFQQNLPVGPTSSAAATLLVMIIVMVLSDILYRNLERPAQHYLNHRFWSKPEDKGQQHVFAVGRKNNADHI